MRSFALLLISLNFGGIFADIDYSAATTTDYTESPEEYLADRLPDAIDLYKNFTDSVFRVLSELGENNTAAAAGIEDDGGSIASLLGISYILASTNEQIWPLSYPIFEDVMKNITFDVLDSLDTVLLDIKDTLSFTNVLFATPTVNASSGKKKVLELIEVDFEEDDATIPVINEKIFNFTNGLLQYNYIQDGVIIPSSTLALVVNIVQTESKWRTPLVPAGRRSFNQREIGNMLQFSGEVKFTEENGEIELIIYFENEKHGLALRMPKNIDNDRSVANIQSLPFVKPSNVTIVIPELKYTLRSTYNLDGENATNCDFERKPNMLQILDVLTYVSLGSDYFHVVSVSGAQIVNVQQLIEEIRNQVDSLIKDQNSGESQPKARLPVNLLQADDPDVAEVDYAEADENAQQSSEVKEEGAVAKESDSVGKEIVPEKVILFNRPFTWMIFDDYVVPIVAGVVTSLKPPEDTPPPVFTLLGTEGNKVSPYLQCFEIPSSSA